MRKLQIGDKITVRHSLHLENPGHISLRNKSGEVTKIITSEGRLVGAFVNIKINRKVRNYFIPAASIEAPDVVNKARTLSLLKSTDL